MNNVDAYFSPYLVLHAVGSVIAVYVVCTLIDILRIKLIEKPFFILWDKMWESISSWYHRTEDKLCAKFNIDSENKS